MTEGLVRLNVNLNRETADMLKRLSEERGMSLTEIIRRAIAVYAFADRERQAGNRITVGDGSERREIILL